MDKGLWASVAIFGLVGLSFLGMGFRLLLSKRKFLSRATPLKGDVVEIEEQRSGRSKTYHPVVEVADKEGRNIRFPSERGNDIGHVKYEIGDRVDVLHDPVDDRYEIKDNVHSLLIPVAMLFLGFMATGAALLIFLFLS